MIYSGSHDQKKSAVNRVKAVLEVRRVCSKGSYAEGMSLPSPGDSRIGVRAVEAPARASADFRVPSLARVEGRARTYVMGEYLPCTRRQAYHSSHCGRVHKPSERPII